ncbi:hypothetical protein P7K49_040176 [Saguinus oedipus]|uniref:Uncharacterized protein n=1 Tax=Saguinus oedipus TaxID=9490 RepID=A0ABQ9T8J3_SAGOE|nr:hypothetical protein P7K49_040176 [Saguinus oedipus]
MPVVTQWRGMTWLSRTEYSLTTQEVETFFKLRITLCKRNKGRGRKSLSLQLLHQQTQSNAKQRNPVRNTVEPRRHTFSRKAPSTLVTTTSAVVRGFVPVSRAGFPAGSPPQERLGALTIRLLEG